jgi:Protein kinase domain
MMTRTAGAELERLKRIDRVCERIEAAWKRGARPRIEDSLEQSSAEEFPELLSEVLLLEWTYRRSRGDRFEASEYSARFPDHTPVVAEAWQRWLGEETPAPASICPEAVASAPEPSPRPAREDRSADAPLQGGYVDWAFIGEGGMGVVYRASDPRLRRTVAVKKLHALTPSRLLRFRIEAEALARLSHPHIVQVFALEELEGQPCLVMEFVSQGSLEDRLGRKPLAPVESARLIAILARAVQAAHGKGIIHRDLKPGNVLMADPVEGSSENVLGDFPKVSDFGLAKLAGDDQQQTGTGQVLGTPHYMAPEQAEGRVDLGPASDVWALGVMLYRCLSGHLPFAGKSVIETLNKVIAETPANFAKEGKVPAALESVCRRCLEKEPVKRPCAGELAETLEKFAQAEVGLNAVTDPNVQTTTLEPGVLSRVPGSATQVVPAERRKSGWGLLIGGGVLAVVLLLAVVLALVIMPHSPTAKRNGGRVIGQPDVDRAPVKPELNVPLVKELRVKHWVNDEKRPWVEVGNEAVAVGFGDDVRIEADFNEPLYAYLIAFNADGKEQLLLPATQRRQYQTDEEAMPEAMRSLVFPHPGRVNFTEGNKPAVWILNDEEKGGTQAFVVVASRKPLPSYAEWKRMRGEAKWVRDPKCIGVWGYGEGKLFTMLAGQRQDRGKEGVEKGVPALEALCGSLTKGQVEAVNALAFQVKPKE